MKDLDLYGFIALIILIIGGLNWGLLGLFDINIISGIFGTLLGRLIYIVVGIAAGYMCYLIYLNRFKKVG